MGRTYAAVYNPSSSTISTHSPRVGRTDTEHDKQKGTRKFQLTRPVWGEPFVIVSAVIVSLISTHSPRVGRTNMAHNPVISQKISTHSPRVGRTFIALSGLRLPDPFQLTRPVWGEPRVVDVGAANAANFNSLAPCGANRKLEALGADIISISTHSPRVGRTKKRK